MKSTSNNNPQVQMDLETYISRYEPDSETRLQRLLFIGQNAPSKEMATLAYSLLEIQLMETGNAKRYFEVFGSCPAKEEENTTGTTTSSTSAGEDVNMQDVSAAGGTDTEAAAVPEAVDSDSMMVDNPEESQVQQKKDQEYDTTATGSTKYSPKDLSFTYSPTFTQNTTATSDLQLRTLQQNLSTAQSCLAKESIRLAHLAIAMHYRRTGELREALPHLFKAKEYSSTGPSTSKAIPDSSVSDGGANGGGGTYIVGQEARVNLQILPCALDTQNYDILTRLNQERIRNGGSNSSSINSRTRGGQSASSLGPASHDAWFTSQFQCALGLAHFAEGRFSDAAREFTTIRTELPSAPPSVKEECVGESLSAMISPEDAALYGGLLGLATMDRNEMSQTLDSMESFRERLELIPALRDAIRHYIRADYGSCLSLLETLRGDWSLDLYLANHADTLWMMVRDKCIVQYCVPYNTVCLEKMMESFGFFENIEEVEEVVADLIVRKKIVGARINGVDHTLNVMSVGELERKERKMMMRKIGRVGDRLLREVEGTILRMACLENNICVNEEGKQGGNSSRRRKNRPGWGNVSGDFYDDVSESSDDPDDRMSSAAVVNEYAD